MLARSGSMSRRNWWSTSSFCGRWWRRVSSASQAATRLTSSAETWPMSRRCRSPGRQSPLRIEGQADVGLGQQLLVAHGLGEEVGVAGLQIEDDVEPGRAQPRRPMAGCGRASSPTSSRRRRRPPTRPDRGDDLERRDHRLRADAAVAAGDVARPLDGGIHRLLAEHPEIVVAGVAVDGDETPTGEEHVAATGQLMDRACWRSAGRRPRRQPQRRRARHGHRERGADSNADIPQPPTW